VFQTSSTAESKPTSQHRCSQGCPTRPWPPKIFRTYSHFVLWEAVSQTK